MLHALGQREVGAETTLRATTQGKLQRQWWGGQVVGKGGTRVHRHCMGWGRHGRGKVPGGTGTAAG